LYLWLSYKILLFWSYSFNEIKGGFMLLHIKQSDFFYRLREYSRLLRFSIPCGSLLLFAPCAFVLVLAYGPHIQWIAFLKFLLGSIIMHSAGCIVNDIIDRDLDKQVDRTKDRPVASGSISITKAFITLVATLAVAASLMVGFHPLSILVCFLALIPIGLYPFMKRLTNYPQAFLGLTFNLGAIIAGIESFGQINLPTLMIYFGSIFWTLGYDTIYALQDKEDDIKAGIKSTALKFGSKVKFFCGLFFALTSLFFLLAGYFQGLNLGFYLGFSLVLAHFFWQISTLDIDNRKSAFTRFNSNVTLALVYVCAIILGSL
jgi:4-hydroxybenzoate polyprenyltransferase